MTTYALISLVILLSLALTGYEIFKMFGRDFGRAIRNKYALLTGFLNIFVAILVWLFIHNVIGVVPTILTALVTGLTFPALLRSRFTLYRTIAPSETDEVSELSLKMDEMYQQLQSALYYEVNLQLTTERQRLSQQIRQAFTARQLENYLADFIEHERLPDEKRKHKSRLTKIKAIEDNKVKHRQLANLLLDLKTAAEIKTAVKNDSLT